MDRSWVTFKGQPEQTTDYIGLDIIPNDVCPSLFKQASMLQFDEDERSNYLDTMYLEGADSRRQERYEYTFSSTLMVNETTCTTRSPATAQNDCNLFHLKGVFMVYFEIANMAKFHFFASKNYYESQSRSFFVPYD